MNLDSDKNRKEAEYHMNGIRICVAAALRNKTLCRADITRELVFSTVVNSNNFINSKYDGSNLKPNSNAMI